MWLVGVRGRGHQGGAAAEEGEEGEGVKGDHPVTRGLPGHGSERKAWSPDDPVEKSYSIKVFL